MKSPCFLGKNGWQKEKPRPTLIPNWAGRAPEADRVGPKECAK